MTAVDYSILPEAFADLEPYAVHWARPTENERNVVRYGATAADFEAFSKALLPRLGALLDYLAGCPVQPDAPAERNALMLACAYAEAAPHHELYKGSSQVPFSFDARRFVADHGDISL